MNKEGKQKVLEILNNNRTWPIIFTGLSAKNFPNAIILPASIPSEDLIISSQTGEKSNWLIEVEKKSQDSKRFILIIDNIDTISEEEQEKFYGILKYKSVNGMDFPDNLQILITANNSEKISKRILSLCLLYKLEK